MTGACDAHLHDPGKQLQSNPSHPVHNCMQCLYRFLLCILLALHTDCVCFMSSSGSSGWS